MTLRTFLKLWAPQATPKTGAEGRHAISDSAWGGQLPQTSESKILTFPDFILTKKSVFPDFQKPIKWPGDWVWP